MPPAATILAERLEAQAQRLRDAGGLGKSDTLIRLFDFLLAQTLLGRSPKEIEIAQDVFGKDGDYEVMLDASVRVYIHRLRRKLEDFYTGDMSGGDRLYIPKGEYRLAIATAAVPAIDAPANSSSDRRWLAGRRLWIALALLLAINLAGWMIYAGTRPTSPATAATRTAFWNPLSTNGLPTVVVTGDYYLFGEAPDTMDVARLVREFSINSKDDLDKYLMAHPVDIGRYVDLGLHYLPTSVPQALRSVLPIVAEPVSEQQGAELMVPMSQLTPDMLKKANIVYIGYLSGLGTLRDAVFEASGFQIGVSYDELIDRATGRRFVSDQADTNSGKAPRRDYAYLASLPGPSGGRVLIVGGTRDAAVLQAAEIVSDAAQLDQIAARAGNAPAFEALYEVRTLDNLNVGSRLVVARALHTDGLWGPDQKRHQAFPDQLQPVK